jgi:hypothetical protein
MPWLRVALQEILRGRAKNAPLSKLGAVKWLLLLRQVNSVLCA